MDGTALDYIIVPIVAILITVAWPALVLWADARQARPRRAPRTPATRAAAASRAPAMDVPRQAQAPARERVPAGAGR